MQSIRKIIFLLLVCFLFIPCAYAKNLVNIYLFYSNTCPHCASERELLSEIENDYDNIKIYEYEVNTNNNFQLLEGVAELMDTTVTGVPFTVIGDKVYKGFSYDNSKAKYIETIEYYSQYEYDDVVGKYIGGIDLPIYEDPKEDQIDEKPVVEEKSTEEKRPSVDEYVDANTSYKINVPLIGVVETKNLTLPVISILIGLVDGFNPCAMWVLLFLISVLIGMKNKKKMLTLGIIFLLTSALIYLVFMMAWLNAASLLISVKWVRLLIGLIALVGSIINLRSYMVHRKDNGCNVVDDKKRNKIITRIKKFTSEKSLILAILGVIALAISVNIVELACSAGLPVMFIEILSLNNLSSLEEIVYIMVYMFFFLLDDLVVFIIAARTMELTGASTKYGKISKLIGGILLLIIGLLLIFKPEWLMFNFQ